MPASVDWGTAFYPTSCPFSITYNYTPPAPSFSLISSDLSFTTLRGAGGGSVGQSVSIQNVGTGVGDLTVSTSGSPLSVSPGSYTGVAVGATVNATVSLNTSAYTAGSGTVSVAPTGAPAHATDTVSYNVGMATAGSGGRTMANFGLALTGTAGSLDLASTDARTEAVVSGVQAGSTVSMAWRAKYDGDGIAETQKLFSDVVYVGGITTGDQYTLIMTIDPTADKAKPHWIARLDLGSDGVVGGTGLATDHWVSATAGYLGASEALNAAPDGVLGHTGWWDDGGVWKAWAVLDYSDVQFAVVPLPPAVWGGIGMFGLEALRRAARSRWRLRVAPFIKQTLLDNWTPRPRPTRRRRFARSSISSRRPASALNKPLAATPPARCPASRHDPRPPNALPPLPAASPRPTPRAFVPLPEKRPGKTNPPPLYPLLTKRTQLCRKLFCGMDLKTREPASDY